LCEDIAFWRLVKLLCKPYIYKIMLSKNQARKIQALHLKKNRVSEGLFIAEGPKLSAEILRSGIIIKEIYATKEWLSHAEIPQLVPVTEISDDELKKISTLSTPNQVLMVCSTPVQEIDYNGIDSGINLYLDDIRDPGNLGTIIRLADWFGVSQVICSPGTAEVYSPKTIQSSMGSITRVKVVNCLFGDLLAGFKERRIAVPIYGALLEGENIYTAKQLAFGLIVIGNESNGISEDVISGLTHRIKIPASSKNGAESLNAAMAASLIVAEFYRRSLTC
jgi:TrmH family RNA methyltransferase